MLILMFRCCKKNNDPVQERCLVVGLEECSYENTEPFYPDIKSGKVVKVYDGDTIHVAALYKNQVYRFMIRLYGYDSPEVKGVSKNDGLRAKDALEKRILNKIVSINILQKKEKYGRLLATISDTDGEINKWMIKEGYGIPYFGGTK
jgi:endonuclease YncB( thermonuclease family)